MRMPPAYPNKKGYRSRVMAEDAVSVTAYPPASAAKGKWHAVRWERSAPRRMGSSSRQIDLKQRRDRSGIACGSGTPAVDYADREDRLAPESIK